MSGQNKGLLTLKKMTKSLNNTGLKTPILSYKVPRSELYMLMKGKPFNLFVPTMESFTHDGNGEQSFNLDNDVIDSASLTDELTVIACPLSDKSTLLDVVSIDYENNVVTVDHDVDEDIQIYYLFSEGNIDISVTAPVGNNNLGVSIFDSSLLKIHSVDQFNKLSLVKLGRSFIVPETFFIKVFYEGSVQVTWHPDNLIGQITLPFRSQPISSFKDYSKNDIFKMAMNEMVNQ